MPIDISKFDGCHLLVVGDLMLDEYLWGDVDRISPEAPVQVVSIKNEDFALGGAGNVVNNIVALGAKVSVVGVIGTGRNGQLLLNKFNELGVDTDRYYRRTWPDHHPENPNYRRQSACTQNRQRNRTKQYQIRP